MSLGERRKARQKHKLFLPPVDYVEEVAMQQLRPPVEDAAGEWGRMNRGGSLPRHVEFSAGTLSSTASGSPLLGVQHRRGSNRSNEFDVAKDVINLLPSHTMAPISPGISPSWHKTQHTVRQRRLGSRSRRGDDSAPDTAGLTSAGYFTLRNPRSRESIDNYVAEIADVIEQNEELMSDSPESEERRLETLREMPEGMGLKRSVKARLSRTVSLNSRNKAPPGASKRFRYRIRAAVNKMRKGARETVSGLELWSSSINEIEGKFGSGVATYFRFLRFLLLLNCAVLIISLGFLVTPQLLFRYYESSNSTEHENFQEQSTSDGPYSNNSEFNFGNLINGEGWLTHTELYYGSYHNESVSLSGRHEYNISSAYFFTMFVCYWLSVAITAVAMARSYRRNYIETEGGLTNVYAQKIFCGWDFGIVNAEAAHLRARNIFNELRELLQEEAQAERLEKENLSWKKRWLLMTSRAAVTLLVAALLIGSGALVWFLLFKQALLVGDGNTPEGQRQAAMMMSVVVTCVMLVLPMIFSRLSALERYANPRNAVLATLLRIFGLEVAIVGVLIAFWLANTVDSECWETSLGQEIYRLIIVDFFICLIGVAVAEFARARLHKSLWPSIGAPEFDIARNTLNLIFNQTLFWVGFYFSPLLAVVIVFKLFLTFYVKKLGVLFNCQPSPRCWRAAQTHTVFLTLTFLASVGVVVTLGYVVTQVKVSPDCGPFAGREYVYDKIFKDVFNLRENSFFWSFIFFFTKPGVVAFIIVALFMLVYYMRAVARAQGTMVELLRNLLFLEAEDKIFLQRSIRQAAIGRFAHHSLPGSRLETLIRHAGAPRKGTI